MDFILPVNHNRLKILTWNVSINTLEIETMNSSPSLADLRDNLVPFTAHQVQTALIWCARDVDDGDALKNDCSYIIDPSSHFPGKIFFAERYGGNGIQRNGGGSRCGFDGVYQVKGIGANLLVGVGTDRIHSNGALGASVAVYEALWGEALSQILPYGSVRARAVLLTDRYLNNPTERPRDPLRRALMVREPVVRPAHFERAPYFRPKPEFAEVLMHDAQRVRAIIRFLPGSLPTPVAGFSEEASRDPKRYCIEGLCELARRQAWQIGFCNARFLRLTSSPSNVAMDGRLLDFNGLSSLFPVDHRYNFEYKLRFTEMMKDPQMLKQGLSDLCLYLGKYLFDPAFTAAASQQVEEAFMQSFEEAFYRYYLEMLGIPADIQPREKLSGQFKKLVGCFVRLLNSRSREWYSPHNDKNDESTLERLVVYLIHRSSGQVCSGFDDVEQDVHLSELMPLFHEAIQCHVTLSQEAGAEVTTTIKGIELLARQRTKSRREIDKAKMFGEIDDLLETYAETPQILREAFAEMETRVQEFAIQVLGRQKPIRYAM